MNAHTFSAISQVSPTLAQTFATAQFSSSELLQSARQASVKAHKATSVAQKQRTKENHLAAVKAHKYAAKLHYAHYKSLPARVSHHLSTKHIHEHRLLAQKHAHYATTCK